MFVNDLFENKKITEGSVQDRLHRRHQELRKKSGLPDPDYYKELKTSYDIEDDAKRIATQAEIKKKYKVAEANVKKPQPYNEPGWTKKLSKQELDAIAGYNEKSIKDIKKEKQDKKPVKENTGVTKHNDYDRWSDEVAAAGGEIYPQRDRVRMVAQSWDGETIGEFHMGTNQGWLMSHGQQGVAEGVERYLEEMRRAGYDIVTERATLCPECGGLAYEDKMLAEKQDACYHKVKSRYKVWPSAYASGALVRCRKKGAKNWGNKSKK